jgi:diaminopimelate decarboxylase
MNIDVIRENITLPPLKRDDNVVVHSVGAYNMTQWMQFIALRPAIVMIDMDGNPHIIRKRETLESIEQDEVLPKYLKSFKL